MIRRIQENAIELREAETEATGNTIYGFTAKFNVPSLPLFDRNVCDEQFIEVIAPGAFTKTLQENKGICALWNHDTTLVLGRVDAGTLTLTQDETGLYFECDLPKTYYGDAVKELIRRRDIKGCSFGFVVMDDSIEFRPDDLPLRTLKEISLYEITPATCFPAYEDTTVELRNLLGNRTTPYLDYYKRKLQLL